MAHSFIETFANETAAFAAFAQSRPDNLVFLLDTYDTEAAARKVVALAPRLKAAGITIRGVRLDSGDIDALSRSVRRILDAGGLSAVTIFASGGLDEDALAALHPRRRADRRPRRRHGADHILRRAHARLRLQTAGICRLARRKRAVNKATWPGRKQVWRRYGADGAHGRRSCRSEGDNHDGEPLIGLVMRDGRRIKPAPTLDDIRQRAKRAARAAA